MKNREQQIEAYLRRQMSEEEIQVYETHLFGCPTCLSDVRVREQIVKQLPSAFGEQSTFGRKHDMLGWLTPRPIKWTLIGAASIFLFALILFWLQSGQNKSVDPTRFTPHPYLESVMRQTYMSTSVLFKVIAPVNGQNFEDDVPFAWQVSDAGRPLKLEVMDNTQAVVFSAMAADSTHEMLVQLPPGIYYWTLEHENEMLYLGKFYVRKP